MKPPRFQYCAPRMLDEALYLLDAYAGDVKVLAGGQSLVPLLNMRLAGPAYLVDINHIAELHYIETEQDGLTIGALARQRQVERSILVQDRHPLLARTIEHIGHMQIRNRGTIVGSIAHADPAAELPALLTCLDGEVLAQSIRSERLIKAQDFFTGYLSTALEPNEMLVEARFPWISEQAGWSFMEFARRSGDYALVGVAAVLTPAADDTCQSASIAYLGVAGAPVRGHAIEALLTGSRLDEQTLDAAAEAARDVVSDDMNDVHATVEYRRSLAAEMTRRALTDAWGRRGRQAQPDQSNIWNEQNGEA
ncbi:MAG TPA: xanthine dehydrogenase family protein subunit M [Ktedonobacteraceae bacterium]|nr:xanthine dehydrogenase family protein subunit M [Ktedonobacteraceae bacterium]